MQTSVTYKGEGRLGTLTFERADGVHVLGPATLATLEKHIGTVAEQDTIDVLLLRGTGGKTFIMGADLRQMEGLSPVEAAQFARQFQRVANAIESLRPITIAAMQGHTYGGGCEISLACDIRIAAEEIKMGLPEVSLGLMPGGGGTARMARLVGTSKAMELILSAGVVTGSEAARIGLVNQAVPRAELAQRVDGFVQAILRHPSQSLRLAKTVLRNTAEGSVRTANALEELAFGLVSSTKDAQEGIASFLGKRAPQWTGS